MDDTAGFMIHFGPDYYMRMIRNDQAWMASIREKAQKENVPDEEMLEKDALFIFQQNYPDYFEINRGITAYADQITADPAQLDSIRREALNYRFDETEMLWISASRDYREAEIARISNAILSDEVWLESVKQKSRERNIPLQEMIRMDAVYVLDQKMK